MNDINSLRSHPTRGDQRRTTIRPAKVPGGRGNRKVGMPNLNIVGIDVFCGAGGLTYGLRKAGIKIVAGIDSDPICDYPFTANTGAKFLKADVREISGKDLAALYPARSIRLLAGCAPCRPFSPYRRGTDTSTDSEWGLLGEFSRLVKELKPELVTMENVPSLASKPIFKSFINDLERLGYRVVAKSLYCPQFGIPQHRRRLVLIASRLGPVAVPEGVFTPENYRTVRDAIGKLPRLAVGEADDADRLHRARAITETNVRRLRASRPGGTWKDWPADLRSECHRKTSGSTYQNVYARMSWDEPSPTITTQAQNFGTGRFGHPEQDRSITPREAALLQTFPRKFRFVKPGEPLILSHVGRLIGNAVPPRLAYHVGKELVRAAVSYTIVEYAEDK
jgi:DNA (cytosine-5)-methyltransferase 1